MTGENVQRSTPKAFASSSPTPLRKATARQAPNVQRKIWLRGAEPLPMNDLRPKSGRSSTNW